MQLPSAGRVMMFAALFAVACAAGPVDDVEEEPVSAGHDAAVPMDTRGAVDAGSGSPPDTAHLRDVASNDTGASRADAADAADAGVGVGVLYTDRIQSGDISDFVPRGGSWSVCQAGDRRAYCQSDPTTPKTTAPWVSLVGDPEWTDYEVKVNATIDDEKGRAMLIFRAWTGGYMAVHVGSFLNSSTGARTQKWELAVYANGKFTANGFAHIGGGSFAFQQGVPFPLRVKVQGQQVTIYRPSGSSNKVTVSMKDMQPKGIVGVGTRMTAGRFTDLTVTRP